MLNYITGTLSVAEKVAGTLSKQEQITGALSVSGKVKGTLSATEKITGTLSVQAGLTAVLSVPKVIEHTYYEGEYEVTPTTETVTLATKGMIAKENITINPIPKNYGLITWDGSTLTVS